MPRSGETTQSLKRWNAKLKKNSTSYPKDYQDCNDVVVQELDVQDEDGVNQFLPSNKATVASMRRRVRGSKGFHPPGLTLCHR